MVAMKMETHCKIADHHTTNEIRLPLSCWFELTKSWMTLAVTKLPPARSDFKDYMGCIKVAQNLKISNEHGKWKFTNSIANLCNNKGQERVVVIEGSHSPTGKRFVFTFPWVHLPVFNIYASCISEELTSNREDYNRY